MPKQFILTDTDTGLSEKSLLRISQDYIALVWEAPPQNSNSFAVLIEGILSGGFELVAPTRSEPLDEEVHSQLLEESLHEYGDIWRRLAQR